jgi:hypothetical protein
MAVVLSNITSIFGRNGGPVAVTTVSRADQLVRFLPNLYERTITSYRHKIRTPFLAKGGEDWPKVHICFALLIAATHRYFNPGARFQGGQQDGTL